MKERFIENGIEYVRNGDYYTPILAVPDDNVYTADFLTEVHNGLRYADARAKSNRIYLILRCYPYPHLNQKNDNIYLY